MNIWNEFLDRFWVPVDRWWRRTHYRLFTPSNILRLRNVERGWIDRNDRFFHAMFTVLCDFVEKEHDGAAGLRKNIAFLKKATAKDPNDAIAARNLRENVAFLRLYRWYTSIDWQNPVPESPEYASLLEKTTFSSTKVRDGTYQLRFDSPNNAELTSQRKIHAMKIQKFEQIKQKRMIRLVKMSYALWT
jgi:hypothetical protein